MSNYLKIYRGTAQLIDWAISQEIKLCVANLKPYKIRAAYAPSINTVLIEETLVGMELIVALAHELGHAQVARKDPEAPARLKAFGDPRAYIIDEISAWVEADELMKLVGLYNDEYKSIKDTALLEAIVHADEHVANLLSISE